jgi:hypothetical protein
LNLCSAHALATYSLMSPAPDNAFRSTCPSFPSLLSAFPSFPSPRAVLISLVGSAAARSTLCAATSSSATAALVARAAAKLPAAEVCVEFDVGMVASSSARRWSDELTRICSADCFSKPDPIGVEGRAVLGGKLVLPLRLLLLMLPELLRGKTVLASPGERRATPATKTPLLASPRALLDLCIPVPSEPPQETEEAEFVDTSRRALTKSCPGRSS